MRNADNLPPYRAVVMKSGSLNFLEPSGPAQTCYGRTLLFTSHRSLDDQIKKEEKGMAFNMFGGEEKFIGFQGFAVEELKTETTSKT